MKMNMRRWERTGLLLVLCLILGICTPVGTFTVAAATSSSASTAETDYWKTVNQKVYYINSKGKKAKGLTKIGSRYYYFDSKGVQRTGWQEIDGSYYYFKIATGKKGYMVKSSTVNGITLRKNGRAKMTKYAKSKLPVLIEANSIVESVTKPTMTRAEKLKLCFNYLMNNYKYRGSLKFYKTTYWEQDYASDMFTKKQGNCYAYGAAFAFLANAVGYTKCYAVSSGGHGWTEINGKVYDISWTLVDKKHNYYGMSYSLSGKGGRPNYKVGRKYVVKI